MVEWEEASPSVIHIAEELIEQHHPWLKDARIGFVFRNEAQKSQGRMILAQASLVPSKLQVYLEFDFMIWVSKKDWEGRLTSAQQEALIDHELCHCMPNQNGGWAMRPHNVQEFWEVIQRHGLWSNDLQRGRELLTRIVQEELPLGVVRAGGMVGAISVENLVNGFKSQLIEEAKQFAEEEGEISAVKLQQKFKIGYVRAKQLMDLIKLASPEQAE
ncbi:MAG TPA: putative metallopeptidase [Bellilinea sp.]|nr:putative metallopeptidase [Bellilinea sp.]